MLREVASLKTLSIPTIQHFNLLIVILLNVKVSTFSAMVLSETNIFVKYDRSTLYQVSYTNLPTPLYNSPVFLACLHLLHHFPTALSLETKFVLSRMVLQSLLTVCSPLWSDAIRKSNLSCSRTEKLSLSFKRECF